MAAAICALVTISAGFSQEVSEKKEIAVLTLGHQRWVIAPASLDRIDEQIREVFVNLGRFSVIGMGYQLDAEDVGTFIENIKRFKAENVEIPEKVQMGQEFFTQADLNRLVASFIVVVPSVVDFRVQRDRAGVWTYAIRTSFSFISVEQLRAFAQFSIETSRSDRYQGIALRAAVDAIAPRLNYEVRRIAEFRLRTGILETRGSDVVVELGRNMGVRAGDEYLIVAPRVLPSGKQITEEKGLLVVRDVREDSSVASVVYSDPPAAPGDQLEELPRVGTESTPYIRAVAWQPVTSSFLLPTLVGIRQTISRGFSSLRPHVGVEVPLHLMLWGVPGVPMNFYVGGEYDLSLGRLTIAPRASAGIGAYVGVGGSEGFILSHGGGSVSVAITYLFSRDMKWEAEAGWLGWVGFADPSYSYGGAFVSGGLTIKF